MTVPVHRMHAKKTNVDTFSTERNDRWIALNRPQCTYTMYGPFGTFALFVRHLYYFFWKSLWFSSGCVVEVVVAIVVVVIAVDIVFVHFSPELLLLLLCLLPFCFLHSFSVLICSICSLCVYVSSTRRTKRFAVLEWICGCVYARQRRCCISDFGVAEQCCLRHVIVNVYCIRHSFTDIPIQHRTYIQTHTQQHNEINSNNNNNTSAAATLESIACRGDLRLVAYHIYYIHTFFMFTVDRVLLVEERLYDRLDVLFIVSIQFVFATFLRLFRIFCISIASIITIYSYRSCVSVVWLVFGRRNFDI